MNNYAEQDISLTKINLDSDNSRYPWRLDSQREIIGWMTGGSKHIGDKVFNLAKDIVEHGLNPLEKIMVSPDEKNNKQYVVLEGNRRITALKLLSNPDMAPTSNWKSRYSKLITSAGYSPQKNVPCVIITDIKEAFHFMEVKHLGQLGGVGVVPWESEEKTRHQMRQNNRTSDHKSISLLDHVRTSSLYDKMTKNNAGPGFPITTLERLLGDKDFRESIGFTMLEGSLAFNIDPNEACKAITKIINDFGSGKEKVGKVISKVKRGEYRDSFRRGETPNNRKLLGEPVKVKELEKFMRHGKISSNTSAKGNFQYINPKDRQYLVVPGTIMPIDTKRFNRPRRMFEELKKLPLQNSIRSSKIVYPNAASYLIRGFLEMSVGCFIDEKGIKHKSPQGWKNVSLTEKTKIVMNYMKDNKLLNAQQVRVLNKALSDKNKLANPDSLNDFIHNVKQIPAPKDLIDIWDTYTDFLSCVWVDLK